MDRSLDSLSSDFAPLAYRWIARCVGRGVQVMIVQTSRTPEEHLANLDAGTSGTTYSLHLPRRLRMSTMTGVNPVFDPDKCDAMDLAPYETYQLHGPDKLQWDSLDRAFSVIAEEAERCALRSGVRWTKPFDPGHAEFVLPVKRALLEEERRKPWPKFR